MNNTLVLALATAALGFNTSVISSEKGPKWDLVEAGYTQVSIDDVDESPSGFNASLLKSVGESFQLTGRYREVSEDVQIFGDTLTGDVSQLSLGMGFHSAITDTTDFYGQLTYEHLELSGSFQGNSGSADDNGLGANIGIRSMLTDNIELAGNIGYLDVADESETSFGVSAYYYPIANTAVGVNYEVWDGIDFISANLRIAF